MRKFILILSIFLIITGLILSIIYIKKINIYKPFAIEIYGINENRYDELIIKAISPLNNEYKISYERSINAWFNYYGYFKEVYLCADSSLVSEIDSLLITSQNNLIKINISDLKFSTILDKSVYLIPSEYFGKKNIPKVLFSMVYSKKSKPLFRNILSIIGLLLFIYMLIIFYKNKFAFNKFSFLIKSFLISTAIAIFIFFTFLYIKYSLSTYITMVIIVCFLGLILNIFSFLIKKTFQLSDTVYAKCKKTIKYLVIILFLLETLLRITGINKSYNERTGSFYMSGFISDMPMNEENPKLHIYPPNNLLIVERKEFEYPFKFNSDGLRDKRRTLDKDSNEYRIICLGNSFTEGIGTPQDSTWPALLEQYLQNENGKSISVFNAGVSSSDPFFEFILLRDKMLAYKPDLVLVTLGYTDLEFYRFRGGFERFTYDGFKYRKPPPWEKIYAVSHICRFFTDKIFNFKFLMSPQEFINDRINALNDTYTCMHFFNHLSHREDFKFAVIFNDDRPPFYKPLMEKLKNENIIDVCDLYEFNTKCEKITNDTYKNLKWPIDGHYNSKGYDLVARGVKWYILKNEYIK